MYSITEAFHGFFRNKLMTTVSLGVMSLSLFIFGIFVIITINLLVIINHAQKRVQIDVFLKDIPDNTEYNDLFLAQNDTLSEFISSIAEVDSIRFISKTDALEKFKIDYPDFSDILRADFNPLPASFTVYPSSGFRSSKYLDSISEKIIRFDQSLGRVEEISYGKAWIDKLDKWIKNITLADLIIGIIISLASIFVIANTIKLNVFARKEQIAIMKLVGASDGLILRPFLLEGLIQGIISGLIASSGILIGLKLIEKWADNILFPILPIFIFLSVIGILFGLFGSWLSLRKYLVDPWIESEIHKGE